MPSAFERYFGYNQVPEWANAYLDFKKLKKKLKEANITPSGGVGHVTVHPQDLQTRPTSPDAGALPLTPPLLATGGLSAGGVYDNGPAEDFTVGSVTVPLLNKKPQVDKEVFLAHFLKAMSHDLDMVNKFFIAKRDNLELRLRNLDSIDGGWGSMNSVLDEIANRSMLSSMQAVLRDMLLETQYLHHYSQLNYTAARKIYKKIDKRFDVELCDGLTDKLKSMEFMDGNSVQYIADGIRKKFAVYFTDGDERAATSQLKIVERTVKPRTLFQLGVQMGIIVSLLTLIFIVAVLPNHVEDGYVRARFYVALPVFRGIGLVIVWLWCWGILCYVWSRYGIAYAYIFDMNPRTELGYLRIFKASSILTIGWLISFFFFFTTNRTKFHFIDISSSYYPLVMCIVAIVMMISPPGAFHFKARLYFLRTLGRVIIAPFGDGTTFRDFFLADVMTSTTKVMFDFVYTGCYYFSGDFSQTGHCVGHYAQNCVCNKVNTWILPIMSALPFWFRLQQCLRKYYDTHESKHLFNALKYLTGISVVLSASIKGFDQMHMDFTLGSHTPMRWLWMVSLIFSSLYNAWWDTFMDWGVFEWKDGGLKMRSNRAFPYKSLYLVSVLLNIVARFAWAISITPRYIDVFRINHQVFIFIISGIEVLRRAHWALYRVEYEYMVNPEKERDITNMPAILLHREERETSLTKRTCQCAVVLFNGIITLSVAATLFYFYHQRMWN